MMPHRAKAKPGVSAGVAMGHASHWRGRPLGVVSTAAALFILGLALPIESPPAQESEFDTITGFRSARFGMSKAEVRIALDSDFGLTADQIEQTTNLSIVIDDLIAENGPAAIVMRETSILSFGGSPDG